MLSRHLGVGRPHCTKLVSGNRLPRHNKWEGKKWGRLLYLPFQLPYHPASGREERRQWVELQKRKPLSSIARQRNLVPDPCAGPHIRLSNSKMVGGPLRTPRQKFYILLHLNYGKTPQTFLKHSYVCTVNFVNNQAWPLDPPQLKYSLPFSAFANTWAIDTHTTICTYILTSTSLFNSHNDSQYNFPPNLSSLPSFQMLFCSSYLMALFCMCLWL